MGPTTYNIVYYQGDSFSVIIYPKDASNAAIPLSSGDEAFFNVADKRGSTATMYFAANATIAQINNAGPYVIIAEMSDIQGTNIQNGYVYDIGFVKDGKRTTVLTGNFVVTQRVKED
jgi:hypothetical protein